MNIIHLTKGETYHFRNFPLIDFFVMAEGRLEVNWYQQDDEESAQTSSVAETLFIRDYLDHQRLDWLYPG